MFPGPLGTSLAGRALAEGKWSIEARNIRDHAIDKHRTVDDTPAGGGAGMVLRADVLAAAIDAVADGRPILAMTPRGAPLTQARVRAACGGRGRDHPVRPLRGLRRAHLRGARRRTGQHRRLYPVGRRAWRDGPARCLHSAAPRRNGRGLQWRGGELRRGAPGISALHPTRHLGRTHDPRSAAIGGSCEDRGVAQSTARSTTHGYGGRT